MKAMGGSSRRSVFVALMAPLVIVGAAAAERLPVLHLVIDDVGLRRDALIPFLKIDGMVRDSTWAIIPSGRHAGRHGKRLRAAGATLFVHVPMEPQKRSAMTPALGEYLEMDDSPTVLREKLARSFGRLPARVRDVIRGLNNHQGSALTEKRRSMDVVMKELKGRALCFLDSRTTSDTSGPIAAEAAGVPFVERDVFIDNVRDAALIRKQLDEALAIARREGSAVAIGHPYPETAEALAQWLSEHRRKVVLKPLCTEDAGDDKAKRRPRKRPR